MMGTISASLFLTGLIVFGFWLGNEGHITIDRPYLHEYQSCQKDLNDVKLKTECKCDCGGTGAIFWVLGSLFYMGGLAFMFWQAQKYNKRRK